MLVNPMVQIQSRSSICRYDDGCTGITNIDFSKGVIKEMMLKNLRKRPLMKWQVMDMTQTKASIPSGIHLQLAPAPHTTPRVCLLGDSRRNSACTLSCRGPCPVP